jgi:hypothetical protein
MPQHWEEELHPRFLNCWTPAQENKNDTLNQLEAVEYALESTAPVNVSQPASGVRSLFLGPRGLRARWRLLIFIALLVVLFGGTAARCIFGSGWLAHHRQWLKLELLWSVFRQQAPMLRFL